MRFFRREREALERNPGKALRELLRGGATIEPLSREDVAERVALLGTIVDGSGAITAGGLVPQQRRDDVIEAVAEVARFARASYARQRADAERRWREQARSSAPAMTPEEARRRFGRAPSVLAPGDALPVVFDGLEARLRADELTIELLRKWAIEDQLVPDPTFDPFPPDPWESREEPPAPRNQTATGRTEIAGEGTGPQAPAYDAQMAADLDRIPRP